MAEQTGSKPVIEMKRKRTLNKKGALVGPIKATEVVVEIIEDSMSRKSTVEKSNKKRKAPDVLEEMGGRANVLEVILTDEDVSEEDIRVTREAVIEMKGVKKISVFKPADRKKALRIFEATDDLVYSGDDHENFQKLSHAQQVQLAVAAKLQELEVENAKAAEELESATRKNFALEKELFDLKEFRIKELELQAKASRSDFSSKSLVLEASQRESGEARWDNGELRSQMEDLKAKCEALEKDKKALVCKMGSWLQEMEGKQPLARKNVVRAALRGITFAEHLALVAGDQMEAGFNLGINQTFT